MRPPASALALFRGLDAPARATVKAALRFGHAHLAGLKRRSRESYADHGVEVAAVLREMTGDPSLLSVAILHDILVHPDGIQLLAASPLAGEERELVRKLHPLRRLHIDANTEELDRVISAFMDDPRLLPLRMAHRLNDVRHFDRFARPLTVRMATESLHMYTSIAGRLGMHQWRTEMESICFPLLCPQAAAHLQKQFDAHRALDETCLTHARRFLLRKLRERGIGCRIDMRVKELYSTYRKMVIKRRRFEELTDRLALRIIVKTEEDCYRTLGIVHAHMHPIPGKWKDYIGVPKENGYRSIHTVVYPLAGVSEQPMEIQIRTDAMHRECDFGPAAHGEYKTIAYALSARPTRVNLFRNLESLRQEARSPRQFAQTLRNYFNEDHIALFDHRNNLYHLKHPATALDFLCLIQPRRVHLLKGVKINGREQPLSTNLRDGDTVEAKFGRETVLRRDWVHAVAHRTSRQIIRMVLRRDMMKAQMLKMREKDGIVTNLT